jgi:penicillin-binding protein 1A
MANWRRFIPRPSGKGPSEERWRRRARTRDARVAMADRPGEVSNLAPIVRESGNGTGASPFPDAQSKGRGRLKKLRMAIVVFGLSVLALVSWVFGIMMAVAQDLPRLEARAQYEAAQNTVVTDRHGVRLATLTNNEGRILVESDQIAPVVKEAVVAIEDARFYEHRGVDFQGIARALYQDVLSGSAQQGASTITQQFVKNALEAQGSRTILQKLREAALAYQLERNWNKDKILTEYLNSIYFGEGAYGIEAAAKTYFGWNHTDCGTQPSEDSCASQLLPWEAAMLAGIISSPSAYSPRNNPEAALARRNQVLQNMVDQGDITSTEYDDYAAQEIPKPGDIEPPQENSAAPYFTSWLRQQLVDKYGAGEAFGGGLEVTSTLDLDFQRQVEDITSSTLAGIEPTSSAVVLDNATAQVLAMVGGNDFEHEPFNLATNGQRQPGSSFKPFTLITALEQGRSPSDVYASQHKEFGYDIKAPKKGGGFEKPVHDIFDVSNYEDTYYGSSDLTTATTHSDNSVYAELGIQVGVQNVAKTAQEMGIQSDLSDSSGNEYSIQGGDWEPYNPALILGGLSTGVTPLEMAHAYETIAMDGTRISGTMAASDGGPVGIVKVTNDDGEPVETLDGVDGIDHAVPKQVIEPEVATTAKSILETVVSSGTGTNAQTDEPTFGKTGTTDDNGDAWFCGATDEITACVWVGYADSRTPMKTLYQGGPVDGGTYPAIIFSQIVDAWEEVQATRGKDDEDEETTTDETSVAPTTYSTTTPTYTTPTTTTTTTPTTTEAAPPADEDTQPPPEEEAGGGTGKGR